MMPTSHDSDDSKLCFLASRLRIDWVIDGLFRFLLFFLFILLFGLDFNLCLFGFFGLLRFLLFLLVIFTFPLRLRSGFLKES